MIKTSLLVFFLLAIIAAGCAKNSADEMPMDNMNMQEDEEFKQMCRDAGYEWMPMKPTKDGKIIQEEKECMGCMVEGIEHVCDMEIFKELTGNQPKLELKTSKLESKVPAIITFNITINEMPANLILYHEKLIHAIIISEDFSDFSHEHPVEIQNGVFRLNHIFAKGGKYLIGADYATKEGTFSKKFIVWVNGSMNGTAKKDFSVQKNFDGYDVGFVAPGISAGKDKVVKYHITKDGKPVNDLEPYLAAAMHLAIVKVDLLEFIHTHGEVVQESKMNHMMENEMHGLPSMSHEVPAAFGPDVEAHITFPIAGIYHIFGEFKHNGKVIVTSFMVG